VIVISKCLLLQAKNVVSSRPEGTLTGEKNIRYYTMKGTKLSLFLTNYILCRAWYFQNAGGGLEGTIKQQIMFF